MTTGINFWNHEVWAFVVTMFYLFAAMILANTLRNTIGPLRKLMIPSSVLGGIILLLVSVIYEEFSGKPMIPTVTLEMLTYHGLGLGFVAMAIRNIEKKQDKHSRSGAFDSGVTVVSGYLIQAVTGLIISMVCYYLSVPSGPPACCCPWATARAPARPTTGAIITRRSTASRGAPASA